MSRLFAYLGNDQNRVQCALYAARQLLVADGAARSFDAWGLGFYQGGEVLLQRRPKPPTEPVDFYALAKDLRTDVLIGHVRQGTIGKSKNENTHPFRFRSWLFAHHGTVPNFESGVAEELLASVPDFLRRNIRGQTDSEHLFHLMLAFLHDANKLDDAQVSTKIVTDAVKSALAIVDKVVGKKDSMECALALTNGRILVATRHGAPVYLQERSSLHDCPVCREPPPRDRRVDHEHLRSVLVVADLAEPPPADLRFAELADRSIVSVNHDLKVETGSL